MSMRNLVEKKILLVAWTILFIGAGCGFTASTAEAATLRISPETGVYSAGATFSARVVVVTGGQSVNAAEGDVSFNPSDLSVVGVSKDGSIFNLWTREPSYSNVNGTLSFGGGSPSGYTGSAGTVMSIIFRTKHAGTTAVTFSGGSILAADGRGTNIISGMQGGSYTVQALTTTPAPEYVAPPNTPAAPNVTSSTHPDQKAWYKEKAAKLSWKLPGDVTALRTALDTKETSIPTKVYETPVANIALSDVPEGVSYFHIQFKNKDGWGRVAHYRLAVDSEKPKTFTIESAEGNDVSTPEQRFFLNVVDTTSGVHTFSIQIDGGDKIKFDDPEGKHLYTTPTLGPGNHTIVAEAFDGAGNSIVASYDFSVNAFEKPLFTEYPKEVPSTVIPVLRGTTRPGAKVIVTLTKVGASGTDHEVIADEQGVFTFIPEARLQEGVYEIKAVATDKSGARSLPSDSIRIAVQEPGYLRIFGTAVSVLSVVVPLFALLILLVLLIWHSFHRFQQLRARIRKEVGEAEQSLVHEFDGVIATLSEHVTSLREVRRGKVTIKEEEIFESLKETLKGAERRVKKEIDDIERLVKR